MIQATDKVRTSSAPAPLPDDGRVALVMAHPGHELRIHGVLERVRPWVYVLTDGSGPGDHGRVASTTRVLDQAGARRGEIYSPFSDASLYQLLLEGRFDALSRLADELAESLARHDVRAVLGDASECYNPAHEVCRLLIDTAIQLAERRGAVRPANYDFLLVGRPDDCAVETRQQCLWLTLDEIELTRKLAAARAYPELAAEVAAARARFGVDVFRVECLRPVARFGSVAPPAGQTPYYEIYGSQRVTAGVYRQVIRYRDHLLPLARRLQRHVEDARA